jgi:hypothetical protein
VTADDTAARAWLKQLRGPDPDAPAPSGGPRVPKEGHTAPAAPDGRQPARDLLASILDPRDGVLRD